MLHDRIVLVSGGTQGVGAGVARAAVRAGAEVVVTGRRPEIGTAFAAGTGTHDVRADVADVDSFLLSPRSGVVTGSVIDWDQHVPGGTD